MSTNYNIDINQQELDALHNFISAHTKEEALHYINEHEWNVLGHMSNAIWGRTQQPVETT